MMKTVAEVSSDKLRGGFYTPDSLVRICLDRIAELCGSRMGLDVLEPCVGDGAFLRGLANHPLERAVNRFLGIEILDSEAQKCREVAEAAPFDATILTTSSLEWAVSTQSDFDVVIGNPPFVRFQFISKEDVFAAERLCHRLGLSYRGVSNLWIPILLGALNRLRLGGSMALVVPDEIFTGVSAGQVRAWLVSRFESLKIDMFEPGSFPDVLQEVVVLSGKRTEMRALHLAVGTRSTKVQFNDHAG